MNEAQRRAAAEIIAGPRKALSGPFIPLLRSPALMQRLQSVGEYLRYESSLPTRLNELAMLVVASHWRNAFEWGVHYPLALEAGVARTVLDALAEGRRPATMADDEAVVHDFLVELLANRGVCDTTFARTRDAFGEQALIDLLVLAGYFTTMCMVLNVAGTPAPAGQAPPLPPLPIC